MVAGLEPRRAALYVDFDNVFSGLMALDRATAFAFATEPARWLRWLAEGGDGGGRRRLLVRRCYLNPAGLTSPLSGGAPAKRDASQVSFGQFRGALVRDGLQVVDCPRFTRSKNAADIMLALDVVDALAHPTRFDEFLILSGDADFTPLLHRLRAHDRLSAVVAPANAAEAFLAAADHVLFLEAFANGCSAPKPAAVTGPMLPLTGCGNPSFLMPDPGTPTKQRAALLALVRRQLEEASGPVRLAAIGKALNVTCAPWVKISAYGGAGTLIKLVQGDEDWAHAPGPAGGWLYDVARHEPPSLAAD